MGKDSWSKLGKINELGFWKFWKLRKCMPSGLEKEILRVMSIPRAPASKHTLVGNFFHDLMELNPISLSVEKVDDEIESLISSYQETISLEPRLKDSAPFGDWSEVNKSCDYFYNQYERVRSKMKGDSKSIAVSEETLFSKSGKLKGRPDLVFIANEGVVLVEYKSGKIFGEASEIKEEFLAQVHFYAFLLNDKIGEWPHKVFLKSLNGEEHEVSISKEYAVSLAVEAEDLLRGLNQKGGDLKSFFDLAQPSESNCQYCRLRPKCNKFTTSQFELKEFDGRYSVSGLIIEKEHKGERVTLRLRPYGDTSTFTIKNILPEYLDKEANKGREVSLLNLRLSGQSEGFEATKGTEIWMIG